MEKNNWKILFFGAGVIGGVKAGVVGIFLYLLISYTMTRWTEINVSSNS